MAYSTPTAADLKDRFPAFAAVPDGAIDGAIREAERLTDASWQDDDRTLAVLLYSAHVLTLDGLGTGTESQLAGFKRLKIGSLELEASASASAATTPMGSTSYGRRFEELMRRLRGPAILVV